MFLMLGRITAGLVLLAGLTLTSAVQALPVKAPPAPPPALDVVPDGAHPRLQWDARLDNLFDWSMASSKIPTACRSGRAAFPAAVAQVDCGPWVDERHRLKPWSGRVLWAAGGGGGGTGARSAALLEGAELTTVPLPGGVILLTSGLAGLAWLRRRR